MTWWKEEGGVKHRESTDGEGRAGGATGKLSLIVS